jgi:site-specific recombinase XerD
MVRFVRFRDTTYPIHLGARHIQGFLTYLADERNVAASTQNQALNALVFLYRHVVVKPIGPIESYLRVHRPRRLPTVRSRHEVDSLLGTAYPSHYPEDFGIVKPIPINVVLNGT